MPGGRTSVSTVTGSCAPDTNAVTTRCGRSDVQEAELPGHRHRGALLGRRAGQDLHRRRVRPARPADAERLYDLGALRLKEMDEAGIDMQVLSHGAPSAQKLSGDGAVALVQRANDRLAAACAANPKRFAALRRAADRRPEGRRRRARALRDQARLQGRDDARPRRTACSSTTSASGRSTSAPRSSTCRSTSIPALPHAARDRGLLQGLRQGVPDGGARRLGLHGRDRDARRSAWCCPACSTSTRS